MERKNITLYLNFDEITIIGISLVHLFSESPRMTKIIRELHPNVDINYLVELIAQARDEMEGEE